MHLSKLAITYHLRILMVLLKKYKVLGMNSLGSASNRTLDYRNINDNFKSKILLYNHKAPGGDTNLKYSGFVTSKSENDNFDTKKSPEYNSSRRIPQKKVPGEANDSSPTSGQTVYYRMDPKTNQLTKIYKEAR